MRAAIRAGVTVTDRETIASVAFQRLEPDNARGRQAVRGCSITELAVAVEPSTRERQRPSGAGVERPAAIAVTPLPSRETPTGVELLVVSVAELAEVVEPAASASRSADKPNRHPQHNIRSPRAVRSLLELLRH